MRSRRCRTFRLLGSLLRPETISPTPSAGRSRTIGLVPSRSYNVWRSDCLSCSNREPRLSSASIRNRGRAMNIVIGSDHRGVEIKGRLLPLLRSQGHQVLDIGAEGAESVDYPDYAYEVAKRVGKGEMDRGLLICGTGTGMCIAA